MAPPGRLLLLLEQLRQLGRELIEPVDLKAWVKSQRLPERGAGEVLVAAEELDDRVPHECVVAVGGRSGSRGIESSPQQGLGRVEMVGRELYAGRIDQLGDTRLAQQRTGRCEYDGDEHDDERPRHAAQSCCGALRASSHGATAVSDPRRPRAGPNVPRGSRSAAAP